MQAMFFSALLCCRVGQLQLVELGWLRGEPNVRFKQLWLLRQQLLVWNMHVWNVSDTNVLARSGCLQVNAVRQQRMPS